MDFIGGLIAICIVLGVFRMAFEFVIFPLAELLIGGLVEIVIWFKKRREK